MLEKSTTFLQLSKEMQFPVVEEVDFAVKSSWSSQEMDIGQVLLHRLLRRFGFPLIALLS